MKKIIFLLLTVFMITGCGNKELDIKKINDMIKADFKDSMKLSNNELEGIYNIDTSVFKNASVYVDKSSNNADVYAVFEVKGDYDAALLETEYFIEQYKKSWDQGYFPEEVKKIKNSEKEEYNNYIIYVVSDNASNAVEKIKGCTK